MMCRINFCPTIKMYDPVANRPKSWTRIDQWTVHSLKILVNQIKRLWQMRYSAQDLANSQFSTQNIRYFSEVQHTLFTSLSKDDLYQHLQMFFVQGVAIQ